jgi:hypothetical protein
VRRALPAGLLAAILVSGNARADGPASEALRDVGVATKDGATYRGELVEKVPADHVTLKLASGEVKRFAWADVADIAIAKEAPDKPDKDDAKPPTVHLVIDGEPGVLLERRQTAAEGWSATIWPGYQYVETWEVSCAAPCTTTVDAASVYRVNGSGVTTSRNFNLPVGRDPLRLHLVGRSAVLHSTSILLTFVGGIVALTGAVGLISSPALTDAAAAADVRSAGWVGVGVGALLLAIAIPTWIVTYSVAHTSDGQTLGSGGAAAPLLAF